MFLQMLQLLIVSYIASHGEGREIETRGRSKYHSIIHQYHLRNEDSPPNLVEPNRSVGKNEESGISRNNPEKNRVPKSKPQLENKSGEKDYQGMNLPRMVDYSGSSSERKVKDSEKEYAQASWNHFIYKMNSASEAVNYQVKPQEIPKAVCKTLPFTQIIEHENCDKVTIQNNLCFGKCNSLYVPNQIHRLNIYSHCLPFKFTMNHLKMNCTGSSNVVKVIMMVEECKCVVLSHNHHVVNNVKNNYGHH
ncbi:cerberus [Bufo gargarizans]|uniref:cerberus n=1 Tax=Bufo gargarizans TaxID=30331 RepID=UPI001CF1948F|nr:cerberus [Bufo gargarizans]